MRTLFLLLYFSACSGWSLLDNERTPVVSVSFFGTRKQADLRRRRIVYASPRFRKLLDVTFSCELLLRLRLMIPVLDAIAAVVLFLSVPSVAAGSGAVFVQSVREL